MSFSYAKCKSILWLLVLILCGGGGLLPSQTMAADSVFEGYVVNLGKSKFLITGREQDESDSAVWFEFKDTEMSLRVGMKLKVEFSYMEQSYPGQSTAEKIEVLETKKPGRSILTQPEAIEKAIKGLPEDCSLPYTFIRNAAFDEKAQTWKVLIDTARAANEEVLTVDFEVPGDGGAVRKNEKRKAVQAAPRAGDLKQAQAQLAVEVDPIKSDLELVAKAQGWNVNDASTVISNQQAFSKILETIKQLDSDAFTDAIHILGPGAEAQLFIKGPVTPAIRKIVDEAPVKIKIIDNQPYSEDEFNKLRERAGKVLQGHQYPILMSSLNASKREINITVRDQEGRTSKVEEVLKLLPPDIAPMVRLQIRPTPRIVRTKVEDK